MTLQLNRIDEGFSTSPQMLPEQMSEAARAGFRTVINNRPDGEGGPDQPRSADIRAAAEQAGLHYVHQPVDPVNITGADVARFAELIQASPGPVLGFCRTGTRSRKLHEAAKANRS